MAHQSFPNGSAGKESTCNAGDTGDSGLIPGWEDLLEKEMECMHACEVTSVVSDSMQPYGQQPTRLLCPQDSLGKNTGVGCIPVFLLEKFHGQKSLAGYNPVGLKELDMTTNDLILTPLSF